MLRVAEGTDNLGFSLKGPLQFRRVGLGGLFVMGYHGKDLTPSSLIGLLKLQSKPLAVGVVHVED